jgi:glycosyltransferase involved in cell wall biosynthesis
MRNHVLFVIESLGLGGSKQAFANLAKYIKDTFPTGTVRIDLFSLTKGKPFSDYLADVDTVYGEDMIGDLDIEKLPGDYNPQNESNYAKFLTFLEENDVDSETTVVAVGGFAAMFLDGFSQKSPGFLRGYIAWLHNNPVKYGDLYRHLPLAYFNALRHASQVVVLTETYKLGYDAAYGLDTIAIPNIIDVQENNKTRTDVIDGKKQALKNANEAHQLRVAFVGRGYATYTKGTDLLAEVVQKITELGLRVELDLVGGSLSEFSDLNRVVENYPVTITHEGTVPPEEALAKIAAADILLATSREEGLPNVIIEASQLGTPTISYDNSGSSEILGKAGVVTLGDATEFADAVQLVLSNPGPFVEHTYRIGESYRPYLGIGARWLLILGLAK